MAVEQTPDFCQHEANMVCFTLGPQAELGLKKNLVAAAEVFEVNRRHGAVGDGDQSALIGADASGTQADVFDYSGAIAEAANVAHAKHFVTENGNAAEKIGNGLLGDEANGQASNAEAGKKSAHVEAEGTKDRESAEAENYRFEDALGQQHERSGTGVTMSQSAIAHAAQQPAHHAPSDPRHADDESDVGDLKVIVPRQQRDTQVADKELMSQGGREQPRGGRDGAPIRNLQLAAPPGPPVHRNFQYNQ